MSTVTELKDLAKAKGIKGYTKMRKAELQAALGMEVTAPPPKPKDGSPKTRAPKPRTAAKRKPAGAADESKEQVEDEDEKVIFISQLSEDGTVESFIIPFAEVADFVKLKEQIKLPQAEREVDETTGVDVVDTLVTKATETLKDGDDYEVPQGQRIVYTATVTMY